VSLDNRVRNSFNSVRKPVGLYVEHLVAMAREVPQDLRRRLAPEGDLRGGAEGLGEHGWSAQSGAPRESPEGGMMPTLPGVRFEVRTRKITTSPFGWSTTTSKAEVAPEMMI